MSDPSNIAEGPARRGPREFIQVIALAEGSLAELDTQLALATDLGHATGAETGDAVALIKEPSRMLNALRGSLETPHT
jgi:four helix bundle protein